MQDNGNNRRNWLITGVGSGLGRALAEAAVARGDHVTGTMRGDSIASFEAIAPGRAKGRRLDLRDSLAMPGLVAAIEAESGPIDILVNNAGYSLIGAVEEAGLEQIRALFEVNVIGAVALIQAVLPFMRKRRRGRIIAISSISGLVGWASLGLYSASKFALEGLCETLAEEVAPLGIGVTLVEPGAIRTDFLGAAAIHTQGKIADYDATAGVNRATLARDANRYGGDPAKAAAAILKVADAAKPPLRLLLGSDAHCYLTAKLTVQQVEMAEWDAVTRSIDDPAP